MKIKFLTLNIYNGHFIDDCIAFLKKENADVFVLQEVYRGGSGETNRDYQALDILKNSFPDYHSYYSAEFFKIINGSKVEAGNAIFSKFAISKTSSVFVAGNYQERKIDNAQEFMNSGRNLQFASIKLSNTELNIFNIHGVWGFDGQDNPARLRMSEIVVKEIKDKQNTILAGDFNLLANTITIKNIEKYLTNVFSNRLPTTFNLKMKREGIKKGFNNWKSNDLKGYAVSAVDMIFVSPNLKILESYQPKVDVSDHYPLIIEVEV